MEADNQKSSLFETPPGIRVIPEELEHSGDPERTIFMEAGDLEESEQLLAGFDPEASIRNTRVSDGHGPPAGPAGLPVPVGRRVGWRWRSRRGVARAMVGPGARFVYALLLMASVLGVMGLAASWRNAEVLMVAGIFCAASGILLWVFWRSWLDGLPYCYRLLTSLGEDAENLLHWRLWTRCGRALRSLYR